MRKSLGLIRIILLLSLFSVSGAATELREWTSSSGKTLSGQMIDFNQQTKKVSLRREDGSTLEAPVAALSEGDRKYIQENIKYFTWEEIRGLDQGQLGYRRLRESEMLGENLEVSDTTKQNGRTKLRLEPGLNYRERLHSEAPKPLKFGVSNDGTIVFMEGAPSGPRIMMVKPFGKAETIYDGDLRMEKEFPDPMPKGGVTALAGKGDQFAFVGRYTGEMGTITALYNLRLTGGEGTVTAWEDPIETAIWSMQVLEGVGEATMLAHEDGGVYHLEFASLGLDFTKTLASFQFKLPIQQSFSAKQFMMNGPEIAGTYLVDLDRATIAPIGELKQDSIHGLVGIWDVSVSPDGKNTVFYNHIKKAFMWLQIQGIHYL